MVQGHEGRWILGTVAGLTLLLSGFVVLLWRIGVFDLPKDDPGAKAFAAVLALVGGLVAAVLTFVGVLLKLAFDARTLELQRETEERQLEAERRQRVSTCIQAVQLIGPSSGKESSQSQRAGALFALANLGQLDFALALLGPMWSNQEVTSSTAIWLIDRALQDPEENIQRPAAALLSANAERLKTPEGDFEWPSCLDQGWMPELSGYAREDIVEALLRCLVSSSRNTWDRTAVNYVTVLLSEVMEKDDNESIRAGAILALQALLEEYYEEDVIIARWEKPLAISELRQRIVGDVEKARGLDTHSVRELVGKLTQWAKPVPAPV